VPDKPTFPVASVDDIQILESNGPWNTKSGGQLTALFNLPMPQMLEKYFHYEPSELEKLSFDTRGLRSYQVSGIAKGSIGANEWHRNRNELVFALQSTATWTCEDVYGRKKAFTLDGTHGAWTPPFIFHTYQAQSDNTQLLVIASTLFVPDDPSTHDSYSEEMFRELQKAYAD